MKRILVVDDDEDILDILCYILKERGYEVAGLLRGDQIMDTLEQFKPGLVLMDVMLAGEDGREICREIKTRPDTHNVPVILISASHNLSQSLRQEGAPDDFIAKPFDVDRLLQKVETHLPPDNQTSSF
jgi:DNA-binding response OmpR family regulator